MMKRPGGEKPLMSGVPESSDTRKIGDSNQHLTARASNAMKFPHHTHQIRDVFQYVQANHFVKGVVQEWKRGFLDIRNDIDPFQAQQIEPDRPFGFSLIASNVENSHPILHCRFPRLQERLRTPLVQGPNIAGSHGLYSFNDFLFRSTDKTLFGFSSA